MCRLIRTEDESRLDIARRMKTEHVYELHNSEEKLMSFWILIRNISDSYVICLFQEDATKRHCREIKRKWSLVDFIAMY